MANGNVLATINADFQHPPAVIPELVNAIRAGADIAIASRHVEGGKIVGWSMHRTLASLLAKGAGVLLLPSVFGRIKDPMSGCFAVRAHLVDLDALNPIGFKSLIEVVGRSRINVIAEIPYSFRPRMHGASKVRPSDTVKYALHLIRLALARWQMPRVGGSPSHQAGA
jgi:dolichol-phosphate mannosyltransferase